MSIKKLDELVDKLKKARDDMDDDYQDHGYDDSYEDNYDDNEDPYDSDNASYEDEDDEPLIDNEDYEDEDDAAGDWLRQQGKKESAPSELKAEPAQAASVDEDEDEAAVAAEPAAKQSRSGYTNWAPREDYTPEEQAKMKEHMDSGYSHREAERLAGAHRGPKDMQSALKHTVKASHPSPKMLSEIRELAGHWLDNAKRHELRNAEISKNPDKFAAGKLMEAHEAHTKDFKSAYDNFLNSDEVKNLKGLARHKAVSEWKKGWQAENPDYTEGHKKVAEAQGAFKEAHDAKRSQRDKLSELFGRMTGGGMDGETYGAQEAAQHVGGGKDESGSYTSSVVTDPAASFASNNKAYIEAKQKELQGPTQQAVAKPKADPKVVIRRHATPEQTQRLQHVMTQKAALTPKTPKGE